VVDGEKPEVDSIDELVTVASVDSAKVSPGWYEPKQVKAADQRPVETLTEENLCTGSLEVI